MGTLTGKVALVTGAARGMGKAISLLFAREGARVVIAARRLEDAQRVATEIGDAALPVVLDVTDRAAWDRAVAAVDARWGRLDVLVNCAGISASASTEAVTDEAWHCHMRTNLDGPFHGCRACLPLMRRSGGPGSVINVSSLFGQRPTPGFAAYCTSKAALTFFTKVFALECAAAKLPIRVNSVHPGGTETDMLEQALAATGLPREEAYAYFARIHPMGRMGKPEEVAAACLWLASDASSFTTGTEINVDGGALIRP
ncbi:SDR family oxidoreductase [Trinickia violacea]|uniref:SDR family oxidoreductase n=1 Tax=Trinickia violacea TaxID=2571746 RepID=A0A4P8IMY1_9BURK|nr:SDR family NAD(P)-dependent oxidoreductase [Trinickia violacea]QCP50352.1 SDR family oxidoreductase [Trinickia violacea]